MRDAGSGNAQWRRSLQHVWHPCTQMQRAATVPPLPIAPPATCSATASRRCWRTLTSGSACSRSGGLLSFGAGPHVCIGAGLTLMEAEIAFGRLLRRFPRLRLVDAQLRWSANAVYRGLSGQPVRQPSATAPENA